MAAVLGPVAVVAVLAGVRVVRVLPERRFFQLVTATLFAVSVKLIWDGLTR